jgi:hypothetical protein
VQISVVAVGAKLPGGWDIVARLEQRSRKAVVSTLPAELRPLAAFPPPHRHRGSLRKTVIGPRRAPRCKQQLTPQPLPSHERQQGGRMSPCRRETEGAVLNGRSAKPLINGPPCGCTDASETAR